MKSKQSDWGTAALILVICCQALPAAAEGGSYPSMELLLAAALGYLLLIPIVAVALAYVAIKLLRSQKAIRVKRAFAVSFAVWIALLLIFNYGNLGKYLSENQALGVGGVLVFGAAFGTVYFAHNVKPPITT